MFVANPKKPEAIEAILRRNKDRLLSFLQEFHNDKDDEQFNDEKQFLIVQSESMSPLPSSTFEVTTLISPLPSSSLTTLIVQTPVISLSDSHLYVLVRLLSLAYHSSR